MSSFILSASFKTKDVFVFTTKILKISMTSESAENEPRGEDCKDIKGKPCLALTLPLLKRETQNASFPRWLFLQKKKKNT